MVTGIPKILLAIPSGLALATLRVAWVPAPDASLEAYPSVEIEATAFLLYPGIDLGPQRSGQYRFSYLVDE